MATIQLPDIVQAARALEQHRHPQEVEIYRNTKEFVLSHQIPTPELCKTFDTTDCSNLAAMSFPSGDPKRVFAGAMLIAILFAYDDLADLPENNIMENKDLIDKKLKKALLDVMDDPGSYVENKEWPIITAWHDFWVQLRDTCRPNTYERVQDAIREYAGALVQQAGDRQDETCPTIQEFKVLRRQTSAVESTLCMIQYHCDLDIPDEVHNHPSIRKISQLSNDLISWSNDVYSFNNEQSRGDFHNLVSVAAINLTLSIPRALAYTFALIKIALLEFQTEVQFLPTFGDEKLDCAVREYVRGMEMHTTGMIEWHLYTPRYFADAVDQVRETLVTKLKPMEESVKAKYVFAYSD